MTCQISSTRLFVEIIVAIAIAEVAVMFILPVVASGVTGGVEAMLDAAMLSLLAGPVIFWRFQRASARQGMHPSSQTGAPRQSTPMILGTTCLVVGVGLSVGLFLKLRDGIRLEAKARYERVSEHLIQEAERRINQCIYGLGGARGVYAASKSVERNEFAAYVASRDLAKEFPGVIGFGFIEHVPRADVDAFIARERADDAPNFSVRTTGTGPDLYVIKYIEPLSRNLPAQGYDIGSDPVQREAAERAVETGEATISRRVHLVQDEQHRTGFLYFLPVYRKGAVLTNASERRANLVGLLYATILLDDALRGIDQDTQAQLDFEIFDGETPTPANKVIDVDGHLDVASGDRPITESYFTDRMFHGLYPTKLGGRTWVFITSTTPRLESTVDATTPVVVGLGGIVLSAVLAYLVWLMGTSRSRATELARQMTSDLRRLAMVAERTTNAVVVTDAMGKIVWVNEGFVRLTGYTLDEAEGRKPGSILQYEKTDPSAVAVLREAVRDGRGCRVEIANRGKHGNEYTLEIEIQPIHDEAGVLTGFIAIENDISERVRAQAELANERDRAESALRDAMALRGAIDQHAIVSVADARGRILDVNQAFCDVSGYTREELIGQDHHIVNAGIHPKSFWIEMWRTIASGRSWHGEVCNRRKDGTLYWVDSMIAPFTDATGAITKYVSIRTDITARKRAEQDVQAATEMLRRTGELARVGGWEFDIGSEYVRWSDEVYKIHEVEPGTPMSVERAISFYAEGAQQQIRDAIALAQSTRKAWDLVLPLNTAKGRRLWVRAQGETVVQRGKVVRLCGAFQNVTMEVLQRQAAEEQARQMELVVNGAGLGIWHWDVRTGAVTFNENWAQMLGYEPSEVEPDVRAWERLVHPDDRARVMEVLTAHLEGRTEEYRCEHRLRHKNGSWVWVLDAGKVTARDGQGKPLHASGVHVDITRAKEAALALEVARDAAQAATRAKSEFLANMSHEIRTPLTAILGYADILREESTTHLSPEQRLATVDTIRHAGQHLLTVINDILDLSKIEAGKMTVERVETPVVGVLSEVEGLLRPRALGKNIAFETRFESPIPDRILGDPTRLRQVLMNLAGNAIKFTELGGVVIVVRTVGEPASTRIQFDIEDTGQGLSAPQAARLFEAFTQADTTVTRKHGGTGLGLMICRRLADLMGGSVCLVRTEVGKGSCFRLELPLEPVAGARLVTGTESVSVRGGGGGSSAERALAGRILLAEDGADNQRLISFHLRRAGAEVEIAENGRIALERLEQREREGKAFDLLITDMQMPEMDGYTLASTLRKRGSALAIVALTAHAMSEDRERCLNAGCDDYATKPIDKVALLAAASRWIGRRSEKAGERSESRRAA